MYANRIREFREAYDAGKGMTPAELAFRIGKSTSTLLRYERGEAQPTLSLARLMAMILGTSVDELIPDQAAEVPAA